MEAYCKAHPLKHLPVGYRFAQVPLEGGGQKGQADVAAAAAAEVPVNIESSARVLLLGLGADEQFGGYSRHKTAFRGGGWPRMRSEMDLDVERLWRRNLGRDDRCCSDHGREIRLPYLDEGVMSFAAVLPLPLLVDPTDIKGRGDKRVVRDVARLLGLTHAASLVKRAIQFGSRVAKQSNVRCFGSNSKASGSATYGGRGGAEEDDG